MARPKLKLTVEGSVAGELRKRFQKTKDVRERERLQAVLLACGGQHSFEEIAGVVGHSKSTVQRWLDAMVAGGIEGLLARGKAKGKSSEMQRADVQTGLQAGLREGRWRTAGQVAAWLNKEHGINRATQTMYYWLGKLEGALKVPRPVHQKKDALKAEAFKGHLLENLRALDLPGSKPVKVWVADEMRHGLQPVTRRCRSLRGARPVVVQRPRYQWGFAWGAMECVSGEAEFLFTDGVSVPASHCFLEQLAASDPQAEHGVIWDQAGFHPLPGAQELPERIHLLPLPPYSPELNPVERLWDVLKDAICNQLFPSLADLQESLAQAMQPFWEDAQRVLSLIGNGWLHTQANAS